MSKQFWEAMIFGEMGLAALFSSLFILAFKDCPLAAGCALTREIEFDCALLLLSD